MHHRKGSRLRIVHRMRARVATVAPKGPLTAAHGCAFSRCSSYTFLTHFSMVFSGIHLSHTACVRAITSARESKTGSSSLPAIIDSCALAACALRQTRRHLRAGLLQLRHRSVRNLRQPPPPGHRRFAMDFPDAPDTPFGLPQPRPSHLVPPAALSARLADYLRLLCGCLASCLHELVGHARVCTFQLLCDHGMASKSL